MSYDAHDTLDDGLDTEDYDPYYDDPQAEAMEDRW